MVNNKDTIAAFVDEDGLFHFGVLGMKWKKRKKEKNKPLFKTTTTEEIVHPKESKSFLNTTYDPPKDYVPDLKDHGDGWIDSDGFLFKGTFEEARKKKFQLDVAVGKQKKTKTSSSSETIELHGEYHK